jgi:hypothetical protein
VNKPIISKEIKSVIKKCSNNFHLKLFQIYIFTYKHIYVYIYIFIFIFIFTCIWHLPDVSVIKNPTAKAEDVSSILQPGRSPEERNGKPLQVFLPGKSHGGLQSVGSQKSWK